MEGRRVKRKYILPLFGLALLLAGGIFGLHSLTQEELREVAHTWEGERTTRGHYILETVRQDQPDYAAASFHVYSAETGNLRYICPDSWRTLDLKSIGWTGEGYDIEVVSGDTGTVTYFYWPEGWRREREEPPAPSETPSTPTKNPYTDPTYYPMPEVQWSEEEWARIQTLAGEEAGEVFGYYRAENGGALCELIQYYQWIGEDVGDEGWRTELFYTSAEGEMPQKYPVENVINGGLDEGERLLFVDVSYDGTPEILVGRGRFGNRGALVYACYFQREGGLQFCESFSNITNPSLDREKKYIMQNYPSSGGHYRWSLHEYQNGDFVEVKRFTLDFSPALGEHEEDLEQWTEEVFQNGQWEVARQWQNDECSYEKLNDLFFNEKNEWAILTERWSWIQTLYQEVE